MTTKWAGWIVAALALAALAAGAVYAASHEAEVRITARQLEDGRVEFALQQRVDGEWGERQLPRSRFFPANVGHNRWLNSTPLTVSVEAEALEETSTGGSAISLSGTGSYADVIDTSAERYVCTFTVSGNSSRYGATNVVVYIGGDLLVNEIEESGTWRAIATHTTGTPSTAPSRSTWHPPLSGNSAATSPSASFGAACCRPGKERNDGTYHHQPRRV